MPAAATGRKVAAFTVVMVLVAAALVLVFGQFRFSTGNTYHAVFLDASRLTTGQDVRMAGMAVGTVAAVELRPDNTVAVTFDVDDRYRLYTTTMAHIRYENLIGDRYLELTFRPGELRALPPGSTILAENTRPALDLDALLGGLQPVLEGLDGEQINAVSTAVIELLQGHDGALAQLLGSTSAFTEHLGARDELIGRVITELNTVLGTVDGKGAQFAAGVDNLQALIAGLADGRDPIAGAIEPLAAAEADLTAMLQDSRRPVQGVVENVRPLAQRLNSLGAYGAFFNIYFCSTKLKINGPAGSDILIPFGGPPDPSKGRCSEDG